MELLNFRGRRGEGTLGVRRRVKNEKSTLWFLNGNMKI
jgi:hypothetical protein